jgi:diguanylate cyclase (GGDEF)-like protein
MHSTVMTTATGLSERRRNQRHTLYLDAEIWRQNLGTWPCKLRDLCRGGMHLAWDCDTPERAPRLQRGDPVAVRVRLAGRQEIAVQATVARVFDSGIGVAIRDLPRETFEALLREPPRYAGGAGSNRSGVSAPAASRRIDYLQAQSKALADPWLRLVIKAFFDQAPDRLFICARDARNNAEQRDYMDAMLILRQQRSRLEPEIAAAGLQGVEGGGSPKDKGPGPAPAHLSLVKDDDLEHLLARSDLVSQAESRHRTMLYRLGQQYEAMLGIPIGVGNLPIAPQVYSDAFSDALASLGLKSNQMWLAYKVLAEILVPRLGDLYQEINDLLTREGIGPDLGHGSAGTQQQAPVARPAPPVQDPPPVLGAGPGYCEPDGRPYGDPGPPPAADPYELVRGLLAMQKRDPVALPPEPDGYRGPAIGPSPMELTATQSCFRAGEIAQVLLDFQHRGRPLAQDVRNGTVRERLQSELARRAGGTRRMGEHEGQAIDAVTSLLNAIDDDPVCGEALKPQIHRLQLPIYKTALTDPAFFSDRAHPARRALDQLARLQSLLGQGQAREEREARIERVIERIAEDFGNNQAVFAEAARDLDEVLAAAEREYADNVAKLVGECQVQQALLRAQTQQAAPAWGDEAPGLRTEASREQGVWIDLAKRLRRGDTLLVDRGSGRPEPLILAWVGEDYHPFVFVDSIGHKAMSVSLQELAMQLRQGQAITAKTAPPPIVDRALYAVAQELHGQIGHQALHDPSTGLQNRKKFLCVLGETLGQARPDGLQPALLYLLVDGVETVAKRYGAAARDGFLKKFVALLERRLETRAHLAQVGDLAFAVLLPALSPDEARSSAFRVLRAIVTSTVKCHSERFTLGASIGLLPLSKDCTDPEALLDSACLASQAARAKGGNCVHESSPGPLRIGASIDWGEWLDRCLSGDGLDLYCRRVLPLKEGGIALPQGELLPGIRFQDRIWIAPEGLEGSQDGEKLLALDRRVIAETLRFMADHPERIEHLAGCTVRLCSAAVLDEPLLYYVLDQLVESPTPPGKVCFEITETAFSKNFTEIQRFVRTLKEFGCRFGVAGFGKTDLGRDYLSKLAMDYLKVDRLFVGDLDANPKDYALVKSANDIGHLLGMQTIAADIETPATIGRLREIGFDYAEGPAVALLQPVADLA